VNVFNFEYIKINNFQKNKLREQYYLKVIIILNKILGFLFIFLMINYLLMVSGEEYNAYFPMDIEICCRSNHLNNTFVQVCWFLIHLVEFLIIFYYIVKLK